MAGGDDSISKLDAPKSQAHEENDEKVKLKEVKEYSLALYRHLQEQLKSRQLSIPRRRLKRRRVTRQTTSTDMYSREPRDLGSGFSIERMLSRGANFVPPVDPKKLRAALDKLLQLADSQKKKGYSYLKPSGPAVRYSKEEYEELNSGDDKDVSLELVTRSTQRVTPEKLQNIESFGFDASLPSEEDDADNNNPFFNPELQITGSLTPYAQAKQGYLPPPVPVDTLARNPSLRRPLDNQRPSRGGDSRYPDGHICPFIDSDEEISLPTVPTRPNIPELDLGQTATTTPTTPATITTVPTTTIKRPGIIKIPGFVPTTSSPVSTEPPSPPRSTPIINEYFDDEFTDVDDYEYDYIDDNIKGGVDPGLKRTVKGVSLTPQNTNNANFNDDQRVIILVEPQGTDNNNRDRVATFFATGERSNASLRNSTRSDQENNNLRTIIVVGNDGSDIPRPIGPTITSSPIILVGPGAKKFQRGNLKNQQVSKDTNGERNPVILVDENTGNGKQTQRQQRPNQEGKKTVILVNENPGNGRQTQRQQRPNQNDQRTVILVDENPENGKQTQRQQRPNQEDQRTVILVDENPGNGRQTQRQQRPNQDDQRTVILVDENPGTGRQTQRQQRPSQEDQRTVIVIDENGGSTRKILRQRRPQGERNAFILVNENPDNIRQKDRPRQEEVDTVIVIDEDTANGRRKQKPRPDDPRTVTLVDENTGNERQILRQQRPSQEEKIQTLIVVDEEDGNVRQKQRPRQEQQTVIVIDEDSAITGKTRRPTQEQNTVILVGEKSGNARQTSRLTEDGRTAVILVDENSSNARKNTRPREDERQAVILVNEKSGNVGQTQRPQDEEKTLILVDESQGNGRERLRLRWKQSTSKTFILLDGRTSTADEGQQDNSNPRGRKVNSQTVIIVDDGGVDGKVAETATLIDDDITDDFKLGAFSKVQVAPQERDGGQTLLLIQPERLSDWKEVILIEDEDDAGDGFRNGQSGSRQRRNEHKAILLIQNDGDSNGKGVLLIEGDGSGGSTRNRFNEGNRGSILRGNGRKTFTVVQPNGAVNNQGSQSGKTYNQTVILLVESEDGKYENIGEGVLEENDDRVILLVEPDEGPKPFNRPSVNTLGRNPTNIQSPFSAPPLFRPSIGLTKNTFIPRNNLGFENLGQPLNLNFNPRTTPDAGPLLARTRRLRSRRRFPSQDYVSIQEHQARLVENGPEPRNRGLRRGRQRLGGGRRRDSSSEYGSVIRDRRRESSGEYGTGLRDRRRGNRERSSPRQEFLGRSPEVTPGQNPYINLREPSSGRELRVPDYVPEFPTGQRSLLRNGREFPGIVPSDLVGARREEDSLRFSPDAREFGTSGRAFELNGPQAWQSKERGRDEFAWSPHFPSYFGSPLYPSSRQPRERPIPEKITELRHAIEAKADAWTHAGLQRTRPEFRRQRRA
ncbi:hypothetical protein Pcinc_018715 [Petrolisthes cinctipes]|uniref:Uncharacterized protein n=1 Tax=Petrolisthes cinctipes TaxID=88211 RepID=A0AAE1KIP6_PETCI|nr:hypothetical protein Pcinc_018715 [Petrolisthes cinctipes]